MLIVLHGEDIAASRNYYHALKQKSTTPITFEGEKITLTDLTQALSGGGLFVEKQEIFIENLLAKKKDSKELAAIFTLFSLEAASHEIVLWEHKELTKKQQDTAKGAQIKVFKLPQSLFSFLDSFKPNNTQTMLKLFHETLENAEGEMVFFMLIRQTRILLGLHDANSSIDEVKRIAPWQRGKLANQAKLFDKTALISLHKKLAELDLGQKTGTNTLPLITAIDFLLGEV